jgi:hypothetical protein
MWDLTCAGEDTGLSESGCRSAINDPPEEKIFHGKGRRERKEKETPFTITSVG